LLAIATVAFPGLAFYLFMPIGGLGLTCTFSFKAKGGFSGSNCGFVFPPLSLGCPVVPTAIQETSHLLLCQANHMLFDGVRYR